MWSIACQEALGKRAIQEDYHAIVFNTENDTPSACADPLLIVSDGMGGHSAGDVASKILVETFAKTYLGTESDCDHWVETSHVALHQGNLALYDYRIAQGFDTVVGATFLAVRMAHGFLSWISVGDSHLYLFRSGELRKLNADHSVGGALRKQIDAGEIDVDTLHNHPDKNALMSAVSGEAIPEIDLQTDAIALTEQDLIVMATDGLNSLDEITLIGLLTKHGHETTQAIGVSLIQAVERCGLNDQDNTTVMIAKSFLS